MLQPKISIIIPVYHEDRMIQQCIKRIIDEADSDVETIVVEAGKEFQPQWVKDYPVTWLRSSGANRALQMNLGAKCSSGDLLVFLHADTYVPVYAMHDAYRRIKNDNYIGGSFRFSLDQNHWRAKITKFGVWLRVKLFQLPYGDQAIFVKREYFFRVGGYPEVPILEDVILVQALKDEGMLLSHPACSVTSSRKWEQYGYWTMTWLNWLTMMKYKSGVILDEISNWRRKYLEKGESV